MRTILSLTGVPRETSAAAVQTRVVHVKYDRDWEEYRCEVTDDGQRREAFDHFTDCREDAVCTARAMIR